MTLHARHQHARLTSEEAKADPRRPDRLLEAAVLGRAAPN
jgi:hypothetical protein